MSIFITMIFKKFFNIFARPVKNQFCKIITISMLVFSLSNAYADDIQGVVNQNPYLVNNVFASAEEQDSSISRNKAMAQANRTAFFIMLENLGADSDSKKNMSDEEIDELVYSRQITEEKIAGKKYSAKFNVTFLKTAVNNLLDQEDVVVKSVKLNNKSEEIFLLFPVEMVRDRPMLWEKANLWHKNVEDFVNTNNIRTIIVPSGNDSDISDVNLENIKEDDFSKFSSILSRYGASGIIVSYYELDTIENKSSITLKTITADGVKKVRLDFINSKNLDQYSLMNESAQRTIKYIINDNKKKETITYKSNDPIVINVEFASLEEWIILHNRIKNMHFVNSLTLKSITRNVAKIVLTSNGDYPDIIRLFTEYNFTLRQGENGEYFLSVTQ